MKMDKKMFHGKKSVLFNKLVEREATDVKREASI